MSVIQQRLHNILDVTLLLDKEWFFQSIKRAMIHVMVLAMEIYIQLNMNNLWQLERKSYTTIKMLISRRVQMGFIHLI